ncbi:MAG: N-acetylmuramoyl-L-alanine amidase [Clostridia bacterium]|nr:N-acetylmuramoyl-L-alanine amidase [Clostridia bacterium]
MIIKSHYVYGFAMFMVLLVVLISTAIIGDEVYTASMPLCGKCIIIDAGHGGIDGGAVSDSGISEKNINLSIASSLKRLLESKGAKVIMTREEDISLHNDDNESVRNKKRSDLINRREIVNNSGADFLISIHLNFFTSPKYKGAQMFYEINHNESKIIAETLQKSLIDNVDRGNTRRAKKLDTSKLLFDNLKIPGVIAECGFLSNREESVLLNTARYQLKIANALCIGILNYFNSKDPEIKSMSQGF